MPDEENDTPLEGIISGTDMAEPEIYVSTSITEGAPTKLEPRPFRVSCKVAIRAHASHFITEGQAEITDDIADAVLVTRVAMLQRRMLAALNDEIEVAKSGLPVDRLTGIVGEQDTPF